MKISDFPLMAIFIAHAFEANSGGGHLVKVTEVIGRFDEWYAAEAWWREFTEGYGDEKAIHDFIALMGMKADEGFTMQDEEGPASLPWQLLDRYY